jgi:hypothetical protein
MEMQQKDWIWTNLTDVEMEESVKILNVAIPAVRRIPPNRKNLSCASLEFENKKDNSSVHTYD